MATLPQLIEEDVSTLRTALDDLLEKSEASSALILDKGGFVISETDAASGFDATTLGALAAAAYAATQGIAGLVGEENFSNVYQQGEQHSLLVSNIDEHCLLLVIFNAQISVGAVKYYATNAIAQIAHQLQIAASRSPEEGIDLSILNLADTADVFARRSSDPSPPPPQPDLQPLFARKAHNPETNVVTAESEAHDTNSVDPATDDPIVKLRKMKDLLASGLISQEDFDLKKRKILEQL